MLLAGDGAAVYCDVAQKGTDAHTAVFRAAGGCRDSAAGDGDVAIEKVNTIAIVICRIADCGDNAAVYNAAA